MAHKGFVTRNLLADLNGSMANKGLQQFEQRLKVGSKELNMGRQYGNSTTPVESMVSFSKMYPLR